MSYQRNQNRLRQREYGCKWQAPKFYIKLALKYMAEKGQTMPDTRSHISVRRAGVGPCLLLLLVAFCAPAAQAQTRLIVRASLGLPGISLSCLLMGCKVVTGLGDPNGQLFLVTLPAILNPVTSLLRLSLETGIVDVEADQTVNAVPTYAFSDSSYLTDEAPTSYYGVT